MPRALRSGPEDDLGLPWERLSDGRLWRLKRGHHFDVEIRALQRAAEVAASRLGKVACVTTERTARIRSWDEYAWIQFVDHAVQVGAPCPCGSAELVRTHPQYAHCPACGAHLRLSSPQEAEEFDGGNGVSGDGEAAAGGVENAGGKALAQAMRPAKGDERFALGEYSSVVFLAAYRKPDRERLYGRAVDPLGTPVLLWVQYTLRTSTTGGAGGAGRPLVHRWPVPAFGPLIDLDLAREPRPGDPPRKVSFSSSHDPLDRRGRRRLHTFSQVTLLSRELLPRRERFYGHAVDEGGARCLVYVDYPLVDGMRLADRDDPTTELHYAYRWPLEPFGAVIDFDRLPHGGEGG